jgi:hypothetical protein
MGRVAGDAGAVTASGEMDGDPRMSERTPGLISAGSPNNGLAAPLFFGSRPSSVPKSRPKTGFGILPEASANQRDETILFCVFLAGRASNSRNLD